MRGSKNLAPLVTVVVPAYNADAFIERTLSSVRQQTYADLEIIVVDDGSTDRTRALIERQAAEDPRIRIISVPNGGVARARNIGIDEATADFVAFIDADDLWHPTKIARQMEALAHQGPGYGACYALHRAIDLEDRVTHTGPGETADGYIFARHLCVHYVGNGSSLLVRRDVARAVGGYEPAYADAGIGGCEDLDFEFKVAASYPIAAVASYLVGYRRYEGNMSSNRRRMVRAMLATVRQHLAANPALPQQARRYALGAAYDYGVWTSLRGGHIPGALVAMGWLLVLDPRRGLNVWRTLARRLLEHMGLIARQDAVEQPGGENPLFYRLEPEIVTRKNADELPRQLQALTAIDKALWSRLSNASA